MQDQIKSQDLSIIVTTSPIRSHPDTQVIDDSINSILNQPSLRQVHIYIICDGAKITEQNKYKSGVITAETMENYEKYKAKLRQKYNKKEKYTIIERQNRHGFAQNIKYAMELYAKTQIVIIYQHDHVIEKLIDFPSVLNTMKKFKNQINYITFMNKSYKTIIPRIISSVPVKDYLVKLIGKQQGYNVAINIKQFTQDFKKYFKNKFGIPLVPLNFWYDKVHLASRKFYLDVIFDQKGNYDPNRGKNMKTVSFPQDTFGHCMKNSIIEKPQKLFQYGAYILWDQVDVFYHQSGRAFISQQQRTEMLKDKNINLNQDQSSKSQGQAQEDNDLSTLF